MARLTRENIDRWFELNLDVEGRTIYMGSIGSDYEGNETGVDNWMAEYFIKGMAVLERISSDKPIIVVMNNPGGDWYHGMAIYDAIKYSTCFTEIKVFGHAMSMGSIILQAADQRTMMPNSRFMIHYGYDGRYGHSKIVEKWADEGKRINHDMENIYLERMLDYEKEKGKKLETALEAILNKQHELSFPRKEPVKLGKFSTKREERKEQLRHVLQQLLNYDTILSPEETISLGLADSVFGK